MKVVNPATEETIGEVQEDSRASIEAKFRALSSGQRAWRETPLETRLNAVRNFYDLLGNRIEELATLLSREVGKPIRQAVEEIYAARGRIIYFLEHAQQWLSPELIIADGETVESIHYEPLGVVCNISSRDYPYLAGVGVFVPAILAGNAVFYKPSEYSTLSGNEMKRMLHQSGIPINVFQTAYGDGTVGEVLLDSPFHGVFFSGSLRTGRLVLERSRSNIITVQLELSGKNPLYVADDVENISLTASLAVNGVFFNSGQSYSSVERIYVHEAVFDAFVEAFTERVENLAVGDPLAESTDIGPLTKREHIVHLEAHVADAISKGARLLTGGHAMKRPGRFFEPTVLIDVDHSMDVMREETYGPVVGIQRVRDDQEALSLMQDSQYGLSAYVFAQDEARAKRLLDEIDVGTVYLNTCGQVSPYLPWSGRRNSGIGSTLSSAGIRAFVKPKGYHVTRT